MAYDSYGNMYISTEGRKPTYSYVLADFTPTTAATDYFTLTNPTGSNKVIRITNLRFNGIATSASLMDVYFYKRTAANTGGTTSSLNAGIVYNDSTNQAPLATLVSYSANPSALGAGNLFVAEHVQIGGTGAQQQPPGVVSYELNGRPAQAIVLRPGELLAISNNGNTIPSGFIVYVTVEWTEETLSYI